MISRNDVTRSLTGVWEIFLDRAGAVALFDASADGFWKSFQAVVLVAPVYIVLVVVDLQTLQIYSQATGDQLDGTAYIAARVVAFGLDWVTLPVLLALLSPSLGIQRGYSAYIVIRNWSSLFTLAPSAVVSLLERAGLFVGTSALFLEGVALAIAVRLSYVAARRALGTPVDVAIGFVILDVLISLGLALGAGYAFGING